MNQLTDEMVESAIQTTGLTMAPLNACLNGYACVLGICTAAVEPKEGWINWTPGEMSHKLGIDKLYAYGVVSGFDGHNLPSATTTTEEERASRVAGYEFGKRWRDKLGLVTPPHI